MAVVAILVIALSAWLIDSAVTGRAPLKSLETILSGGTLTDANNVKSTPINSPGTDTGYVSETSTPASTGGSYTAWFTNLLNTLNIPVTPGALQGLASVVREEGANAYNNPFNIEYHEGQSTAWRGIANFNSVGVQEYATPQAGVNATAAFLTNNPRYRNLLNALRSGDFQSIENAFVSEYTWAPFRTSTQQQANAILAQDMGAS